MNPTQNDQLTLTTILAIGTVLGPIIFGFALWKMSQIFVSKESFNEYKANAEKQREEMRDTLASMNKSLNRLLQRTAHLKNGEDD